MWTVSWGSSCFTIELDVAVLPDDQIDETEELLAQEPFAFYVFFWLKILP